MRILSNRMLRPLQYSELGFLIFDPVNYFTLQKNMKIMHDFAKTLINERRAALVKSIADGTHESIGV